MHGMRDLGEHLEHVASARLWRLGLGVGERRLGFLLALMLVACGATRKSPSAAAGGEGGAQDTMPNGAQSGSGATARGGSSSGAPAGGTAAIAGGEGGAGGDAACIDGALCTCGELTGTLQCDASGGHCSCPPANVCQAPHGSCFEPCGGDALGLWVLEETCFGGGEIGAGCAGGSIEGKATVADLRLLILENESISAIGSEALDINASVPLACLGIESINRCVDAEFYAAPLLYSSSTPLKCQPSPCGSCDCVGNVSGYAGYQATGTAWTPGSPTLSLGAVKVPYCVDGDSMWVGGDGSGDEPKVAYKLRRRSCVGKPQACAERAPDQCGSDCSSGHCLPDGADPSNCAQFFDHDGCSLQAACHWQPGACWGTPSETCNFINCDTTPGCSWGAPQARCGGDPSPCYAHDVSDCNVQGCSVQTCEATDGSGIDPAISCAQLSAARCPTAPGCTWNGTACTGTTSCAKQTNSGLCDLLGCISYDTAFCGGAPEVSCSALSLENCASEPGCRQEW